MTKSFQYGQSILIRGTWREKLWTARPMRLVEDAPEVIALHIPPGTVCKHPCATSGGPVAELLPDEWRLAVTEEMRSGRWSADTWTDWTPPAEWNAVSFPHNSAWSILE